MSYRPGATLATAPTLGLADTSDLGPTAGNGFFTRWPDDLAMLQDHGITDVRLTLDWARLQPRPGVVDDGWAEYFEQILTAARAIGLDVWATMYDGAVPRWFDNEGGIGDDEAFVTWWPRFVGRVAERFGDLVQGWIPFAVIPGESPDQPWRDTWGILGGGGAPVVASVSGTDLDRVPRLAGMIDRIGIDLDHDVERDPDEDLDHDLDETEMTEMTERWGESLAAGAAAAGTPVVACLTPGEVDPELGGRLVASLATAAGWAIADGAEVTVCFVDPGIAGPDLRSGLFDVDRAPLPAIGALVRDAQTRPR